MKDKMKCIFCDTENNAKSIEHIISESFGNKEYVMQKGAVCDNCNSRFSNFEGIALTNSVYIMERARFGIVTKKGKNAKGKVNELIIEGDKDFKKNYLNIKGLNPKNFRDFDPKTKIAHLFIESFDKSEVATSKLILKIGLESIYTSQRQIFNKYNFKELKDYLTNKNNYDWPFLMTDIGTLTSVPNLTEESHLKNIHCELKFSEVNNETLLFNFKYGAIPVTINLINRNLNWIKEFLKHDEKATLYPLHYRGKLAKY